MSNRRNANNNRIRGPQSALTDFLASNNISAAQIRADWEARQLAAADDDDAETQENSGIADRNVAGSAGDEGAQDEENTDNNATQSRKRKRQQKAAVEKEKIKQSRAIKKRTGLKNIDSNADEEDVTLDIYQKSKPTPGQLSHCDICDKRFTVTPYSKEGSNGGLLCPKCSKESNGHDKNSRKEKKVPIKRSGRRQNMSNLLDGNVKHGSKALLDLCLEKVADVSNDIDSFGAWLPEALLDRLSMIFSKRRVLTTRTSHLFLRPDRDKIVIYDAAQLETSDYGQIFAIVPKLKHLKITNAGQMKDETIEYMIDRDIRLETLLLEAPNLITDEKWQLMFRSMGVHLRNFKIDGMDSSFTDETVAVMADECPRLNRLKIRGCTKLTESSIGTISQLKHLEHLSLAFENPVSVESLVHLLTSVAEKLVTLSLEGFEGAGDEVLHIIHQKFQKLKKFRFMSNDYATDAAFADLFTSWPNSALTYADFSGCRDVDNQNPDGPEEPIGLASNGFTALMKHSGAKIETLKISSCRHISHSTLQSIFDGKNQYLKLREIDLSLIPEIDDVIVAGIFKSCPSIKKVVVFACFGVRDVVIPPGVALIGVPKAHAEIVQGNHDMI